MRASCSASGHFSSLMRVMARLEKNVGSVGFFWILFVDFAVRMDILGGCLASCGVRQRSIALTLVRRDPRRRCNRLA